MFLVLLAAAVTVMALLAALLVGTVGSNDGSSVATVSWGFW